MGPGQPGQQHFVAALTFSDRSGFGGGGDGECLNTLKFYFKLILTSIKPVKNFNKIRCNITCKQGCDSRFSYCFLTDSTKFFL